MKSGGPPDEIFTAFARVSLPPLRTGTLLESLHRRKMDLCHTIKLRFALWRREDLRRDDLGFSGKLRDRQGNMFFHVHLFKSGDVHWWWICNNQLRTTHI